MYFKDHKMKFLLNNREEIIEIIEPLSVRKLLTIRKMSFRMFLVKVNGVLINKKKFEDTIINEGDEVQVLYLMSGG